MLDIKDKKTQKCGIKTLRHKEILVHQFSFLAWSIRWRYSMFHGFIYRYIWCQSKYSWPVHNVLKFAYFEEFIWILHTHGTPVWHGYAKTNDGIKQRRYLSFPKNKGMILLNPPYVRRWETYNVEHWRKVVSGLRYL